MENRGKVLWVPCKRLVPQGLAFFRNLSYDWSLPSYFIGTVNSGGRVKSNEINF